LGDVVLGDVVLGKVLLGVAFLGVAFLGVALLGKFAIAPKDDRVVEMGVVEELIDAKDGFARQYGAKVRSP
jgi:hypothetical protein